MIGGGDSAMEEALFLTRFATKVTLINRSENFRASKIMLDRAMAHPQIEFVTNTMVEEVLGVEEKEVKGLRLKNRGHGRRVRSAGLGDVSRHRPRAERQDVHRHDRS